MSEGAWQDSRSSGNRWYQTPTEENTNWRAPGHDRMFHGDGSWDGDNPGRQFTTRKKHGWWGREEYYDVNGNKIG